MVVTKLQGLDLSHLEKKVALQPPPTQPFKIPLALDFTLRLAQVSQIQGKPASCFFNNSSCKQYWGSIIKSSSSLGSTSGRPPLPQALPHPMLCLTLPSLCQHQFLLL